MAGRTDDGRRDMLNRIRKNIQSNYEYYGQGAQHLYKATISADDVIAFTNARQEFEIIQYRGVKDIEEIPRAGVSAEYKEISAVTTYTLDEIDEKSDLAVDLFSHWYRQNKNGEV